MAQSSHTTDVRFKQTLLSFVRRLCAHGVVPHKLPLRAARGVLGGLRGLRALHGEVAQCVRPPPLAQLRGEQGRLLRGAALHVPGRQVVRGAQEPGSAIGRGQGLLVTHGGLLVADRQTDQMDPGKSVGFTKL